MCYNIVCITIIFNLLFNYCQLCEMYDLKLSKFYVAVIMLFSFCLKFKREAELFIFTVIVTNVHGKILIYNRRCSSENKTIN